MGRIKIQSLPVILISALAIAGCSSQRPVFYPNAYLERVGMTQAQVDADLCMAEAQEQGVKDGSDAKVGGQAVKGAAVGAAVSAVVSALLGGNVGRAIGAGAAGGATAGAISGGFDAQDPDAVFKNYVNRCLQKKGYEVVGWQ